MLQITVEYSRPPPQIFVARLRRFCLDKQNSPNCQVSLNWEQATLQTQPPAQPSGVSCRGIYTTQYAVKNMT